jgi:glycosyltransferase involved in cell wall biosynthesis
MRNESDKKKILVFIDWFYPGYKSGGPARSMVNMIERLGNEYEFYVVTRNTDYMESTPYDRPVNQWVDGVGGCRVYYIESRGFGLGTLRKVIASKTFDIAYVNGIYSLWFSIVPLLLLRFYPIRMIVGVRGMLAQSAINVKRGKKEVFLKVARWLGLYQQVMFHATNAREADDVKRVLGKRVKVMVADNLPGVLAPSPATIHKLPGKIRLVALARIAPEKNSLFALQCLMNIPQSIQVELNLYGQIYDSGYWIDCQNVIAQLPAQVNVNYMGMVPADEVNGILAAHHALLMPSQGENFGHVILECFMAARPVLISDQTPWRGLEDNQSGWDLPLDHPEHFTNTIIKMAKMGQEEYDEWCNGAYGMAERFVNNERVLEGYREIFGDPSLRTITIVRNEASH